MSELPPGWQLKRLGDCLEKLKSGKFAERGWSPQCLSNPAANEDSWGVLKTTAVQMGAYVPQHNKELPTSLEPKVGLEVNAGDFLVTTTGPRNRCGVVCLVKATPKKLIFSGKILRFRANEEIVLAKWLMYLLMSPNYQEILDRMKVGTSDSSVSIGNSQVLDLEILVPPVNEQYKIVESLEEQLSRLDAGVHTLKELNTKLLAHKRSLLQAAFSGQLGDGRARLASELPTGWSEVSLSEVCVRATKIDPLSLGRKEFTYVDIASIDSALNLVSAPQILSVEDAPGRARQLLVEGDTVFSTVRPYLKKIGWITQSFNGEIASTGFCVLRADRMVLDPRFLFNFAISDCLMDQILPLQRGVSYPAVRDNDVLAAVLPLPPLEQQRLIVHILDKQLSLAERMLEVVSSQLMRSSQLRKAILHSAFVGKLNKESLNV